MNDSTVLLVGSGPMAIEYAKILRSMNITPVVVGRGAASAAIFAAETGFLVAEGGIDAWLAANADALPERAIVAAGEKWVGKIASALIERGVRSMLVEKPGGYDAQDIRAVLAKADGAGAAVYVGYNRRFYASVDAAKKIIADDGGVTSFNFEFTEWSHVISGIEKEDGVKEQWFLSNSTHVVDLAFYLGGRPSEMVSFAAGSLDWHPAGSVFAGAGKTEAGAVFSYQANWEAPGRWGVEILTRKHRLIFRPLEKLQIQKIGSVAIDLVDIDDKLDKDYKPGLFNQVKAFLGKDKSSLPTIAEQAQNLDAYLKMRDGLR